MEDIEMLTLTDNCIALTLAPVGGDFDVEFSPGKRLAYSRLNEQVLLYIRDYSLSFTPERLRALRNRIATINEALRRQTHSVMCAKDYNVLYKDHIGAGIYVSVDNLQRGVDLRRHWFSDTQCSFMPSRSVIILSAMEWIVFKAKLNELLAAYPELDDAKECMHDPHMCPMDCSECMPFW